MPHRVFRLSITPERAPDVRRVVDFDGRSTLHDVHKALQRELNLDDDHLYAFFLSGRYFDQSSEYGADASSPHDARETLLFRLGLKAGQSFAYLFDFGDELRHTVTVDSVTDVEQRLPAPVLVEARGDAPSQYRLREGEAEPDEEHEPHQLPEHLVPVAPLADVVLTLSERLDELYEEDEQQGQASGSDDAPAPVAAEQRGEIATSEAEVSGVPQEIRQLISGVAEAALELAAELKEDAEALQDLDEWSADRELLPRLLELPLGLVAAGELESALAIARAYQFAAEESLSWDVAVIFAESGKRDAALAQIDSNRKQFSESFLSAIKAGAAYEALGDLSAAEASYRQGIVLAEDGNQEDDAINLLSDLLEDMGRFEEVEALHEPVQHAPLVSNPPSTAVGRNDPCPCGSGKKYKKCHGA